MILLPEVLTGSGAACATLDDVNTPVEPSDVKTIAGTVTMAINTRFIGDSFHPLTNQHTLHGTTTSHRRGSRNGLHFVAGCGHSTWPVSAQGRANAGRHSDGLSSTPRCVRSKENRELSAGLRHRRREGRQRARSTRTRRWTRRLQRCFPAEACTVSLLTHFYYPITHGQQCLGGCGGAGLGGDQLPPRRRIRVGLLQVQRALISLQAGPRPNV
jgi:hypothetical protein